MSQVSVATSDDKAPDKNVRARSTVGPAKFKLLL